VQPPDGVPLLLDLYRLRSATPHRYDYVLHPLGEVASASIDFADVNRVAGDADGYQHLLVKQESGTLDGGCQLTWALKAQRYTWHAAPGSVPYQLLVAELGANDPHDNLRHEPAWLLRADGASDHAFASVFEAHGTADQGQVRTLRIFAQSADATGVLVEADGYRLRWLVAHGPADGTAVHRLSADGTTWEWTGVADVRIEPSE
jgi:hypothetical protein